MMHSTRRQRALERRALRLQVETGATALLRRADELVRLDRASHLRDGLVAARFELELQQTRALDRIYNAALDRIVGTHSPESIAASRELVTWERAA